MSRVIKKKLSHKPKIQLIRDEVQKERKTVNKIWTLEGITFIAFIATLISSYILFALSTWTQVNLIPKRNSQFSQIQVFQQARMQEFENLRKSWLTLRLGYTDFISACSKRKITGSELDQYTKQNLKLVNDFRAATGGEVVPYYYGEAIEKIFKSEFLWYVDYADKCPLKPGGSVEKLTSKLREREEILMVLLLRKAFNSSTFDKYHDNPYYANF